MMLQIVVGLTMLATVSAFIGGQVLPRNSKTIVMMADKSKSLPFLPQPPNIVGMAGDVGMPIVDACIPLQLSQHQIFPFHNRRQLTNITLRIRPFWFLGSYRRSLATWGRAQAWSYLHACRTWICRFSLFPTPWRSPSGRQLDDFAYHFFITSQTSHLSYHPNSKHR